MRKILRNLLPPILTDLINKLRGNIAWNGEYSTWDEALALCPHYDSPNMLGNVKDATLKVKYGEAIYERDSGIHDEIQYSWQILAGLMWVAARDGGRLDVLDFGGSLGSSYFQNRKFLSSLPEVNWSIVEQPHFVSCGRDCIEDSCLKFYMSIEECFDIRNPNVVLFSGVLSYLPDWSDFLKKILAKKISTILVDRTAFTLDDREIIAVQTVPNRVYLSTCPFWFFNKKKFINIFSEAGYQMIEEFIAIDNANLPSVHKGFIFLYCDK